MLAARRMMNRRAVPTTHVQIDDFNRTDTATDINLASDGGTYDATLLTSSVYGVSSNRGYIPTAGNLFDVVLADCGSLDTDVTITNIRANTTSASIIWFCLDYTNPTVDGYGLEFDSGAFMHIIDYRTATQRESPIISPNFWTGGSSTLRITFNHTTGLTTIYQDGVNIWSHAISGALSTGAGAGFGSNVDSATAGEFWDDLQAIPL